MEKEEKIDPIDEANQDDLTLDDLDVGIYATFYTHDATHTGSVKRLNKKSLRILLDDGSEETLQHADLTRIIPCQPRDAGAEDEGPEAEAASYEHNTEAMEEAVEDLSGQETSKSEGPIVENCATILQVTMEHADCCSEKLLAASTRSTRNSPPVAASSAARRISQSRASGGAATAADGLSTEDLSEDTKFCSEEEGEVELELQQSNESYVMCQLSPIHEIEMVSSNLRADDGGHS